MPLRSLVTYLLVLVVSARGAAADGDAINAELGDASWVAAHGRAPASADAERARIATHLTYVLGELRAVRVAPDVQPRRTEALAALERYIARGEFPRRTGDPYAGRRPRFIDDRGVHCAVGQLIAETGAPELARAIDAEHEYAYVRDITTPGLAAWARTTGFTVDELAMIQPTYLYRSAPTRSSTKRDLEDDEQRLTVACAQKHPPPKELDLHVLGTKQGRVIVSSRATSPFARCFVRHAQRVVQRGASIGRPETFKYALTLKLSDPARLFAAELAVLEPSASCWLRPGALVRSATLTVSMNNGLLVTATTSPSNDEVAHCLRYDVAARLGHYVSTAWTHRAERQVLLARGMSEHWVRDRITAHLPRVALDCYAGDPLPDRLTVSVSARTDAPALALAFPAVPEPRATCLRDTLGRRLQGQIDTDVDTSVTVELGR